MRNGLWIIAMAALIARARATEPTCPVLNAATAGGVLGGAVTSTTTGVEGDGRCEFVRTDSPRPLSLRIEMAAMKDPVSEFTAYAAARCGSAGTAMRAIGNEAVACGQDSAERGISELVVSRVREHAFFVRIDAADTSMDRNALRAKARKVAEQVAGNLF